MGPLCYRRHHFPPEIIQHAIWLYLRFTLSYRDVEELLAERGLDMSYETVRRWVLKFGPAIARRLRQRRPRPSDSWHLDEMVVRIAGERMYLWRAVDDEGEVLDMLVQRRRNKHAALKLLRRLLKRQGIHPETITTDKLASYGAAARDWGSLTVTDLAACARITAPRTRTCRSGAESGRCSGSNPRAKPSVSSPPMPPSTTASTPSPI